MNKDGSCCVRIFDVSSSTGLGIEGYLTCWKDELGNHTLGMKAQNMHQLRVLGAKQQALYFLPLVPMLWHSAEILRFVKKKLDFTFLSLGLLFNPKNSQLVHILSFHS